jgi:hypothetical protein
MADQSSSSLPEPTGNSLPGDSGLSGGLGGPGGAGAPGDPGVPDVPDVEMLAAALRADSSDLDSYHRVLSNTLGEMLPAEMVEVDRDRSLSDRMAGRPGTATAIRLHLGDATLELVTRKGRLVATSAQEVRGVVISKKEIAVADWVRQLAEFVSRAASESAEARQALGKLLGS